MWHRKNQDAMLLYRKNNPDERIEINLTEVSDLKICLI